MRFIRTLVILFLLTSCMENSKVKELEKFKKLAGDRNTIIISCNRCGCVTEALNDVFVRYPAKLNSYLIYGDSLCLQNLHPGIKVSYISQSMLDSISTGFHNLLIIRKTRAGCSYTVLKTNEAKDLAKLLE